MLARLLNRVLLAVPTLLGLTLLVFLLVSFSPGGVSGGLAAALGGGEGGEGGRDVRRIQYLEERYGLHKPVLVQYANWLGQLSPIKLGAAPQNPDREGGASPASGITLIPNTLRLAWPDLGFSFMRNQPVSTCLREAIGVTLLLNTLAYTLMYAVAVPAGILSAAKRGTWIDRGISGTFALLWSVPSVCMAVILVGVFASRDMLGWFPSGELHSADAPSMPFLPSFDGAGRFVPGWALDSAHRLVLPVLCQAYGGIAIVTRLVRLGVLDNLGAPFVRTARAKGLPERDVVVYHAFRAGMLPLVTVFGATLPAMLSGSVVVEKVFSLPGMGSLVLEAVSLRDRELLMGTTLVAGVLTVLGVLVADVLYQVLDRRTRRA
ncbi:MAG: ABC transporter permease [Phycisphaerales bacterium]